MRRVLLGLLTAALLLGAVRVENGSRRELRDVNTIAVVANDPDIAKETKEALAAVPVPIVADDAAPDAILVVTVTAELRRPAPEPPSTSECTPCQARQAQLALPSDETHRAALSLIVPRDATTVRRLLFLETSGNRGSHPERLLVRQFVTAWKKAHRE